jgi:hypothetical protein
MAATSLETTKTIRLQSVSSDLPNTLKSDHLEPAAVFVAWQVAKTEPRGKRKSDSKRQPSDPSMLPFVWLG